MCPNDVSLTVTDVASQDRHWADWNRIPKRESPVGNGNAFRRLHPVATQFVLKSLLTTFCRFRWATLTVGVVACIAAAVAIPGLSFNDSPERWMPASAVDDWYTFGEHFEFGDSIVVAVHFHREITEDDSKYLKGIRRKIGKIKGVASVIDPSRIAEEIELVPFESFISDSPDSPHAMYHGVLFDSPRKWKPDADTSKYTADELDGRSAIVYIEFEDFPSEALKTRAELDEMRRRVVPEIFAVLDPHERDDVTFHVIGSIVVQHELEKSARKVAFTFVPLSLALTFFALGVGFRSLKAVLIAVVGALWGVTIMLGGIAWAGWSLNVITVGGPTLMFVIVIATTVHFAHDASEKAHHPKNETEISHFVHWVAFPCLGAAVTTGIGFLMLTFNELQPTQELGIGLCIGAVLAFFGAFLMWLVLHPMRAADGKYLTVERFSRFESRITARPQLTLTLSAGLIIALCLSGMRVSVDADPFSFFHHRSRMAAAFRHVTHRQFGLHRLEVLLIPRNHPADPTERAASERDDLEAARKFQTTVAARPEVRNIVSTLKLSQRIEEIKKNGDSTSQLRAEGMEEYFRNWLHDRKGKGAMRFTFKVDDLGEGFQPFLKAVRESQPDDRFQVVLTGTAANVVVLSEGLLGGITRGLLTALLVMAVLCVVWFRSLRLTLIAFVPNVFPILAVFGLMGLLGIPLNCGSAMVMTISLGIALNDTVHFIVHYRQHKSAGVDTDTAVAATIREIGRPIVMTSIVNSLGFAIFALSDFRPMFHFGCLTAVAMLAALVGDLVLLPNLLKLFDRELIDNVDDTLPPSNHTRVDVT